MLSATVNSSKFDYVILMLILGSCVTVAIDNPLNNPDGMTSLSLRITNEVFSSLFILEAVIKIIALGFLFNGKGSYLKNPWNIMDLLIILFNIFSTAITSNNFKGAKVLRLLRVLRPLRVISKNEGLKVSKIYLS